MNRYAKYKEREMDKSIKQQTEKVESDKGSD